VKYEVTGPDGSIYDIEGPDDATDEELISAVKNQLATSVEEKEELEQTLKPTVVTDNTSAQQELDAIRTGEVEAKVVEEKRQDELGYFDEGSVIKETGEGIVSGLIAIPQGILELGGSLIDLAADTDLASSVTESANELRDVLGVDPEGMAGKIAEVATQFVIPGIAAASAVSKLSKVGKLVRAGKARTAVTGQKLNPITKTAMVSKSNRVALIAQQAAAAGLADAAVATDGITTIGDFFDGGPTTTDQEVGLHGRDEALRRLSNKLKIGIESSTIVGSLPAVISGTGKAFGAAKDAVTPIAGAIDDATGISDKIVSATAPVARGIKKVTEPIGKYVDESEQRFAFGQDDTLKFGDKTLNSILRNVRYRGLLPEEIAEARSRQPGFQSAEAKKALIKMNRLEKAMNASLDEFKNLTKGTESQLTRKSLHNTVFEVLTANNRASRITAYKTLPPSIRKILKPQIQGMTSQIDDLSKQIINLDALKTLAKSGDEGAKNVARIKQTITNNLSGYMRRRYAIYEEGLFGKGAYKPTDEAIQAGVRGFSNPRNVARLENELTILAGPNTDNFINFGLDAEGKLLKNLTPDTLNDLSVKATTNFVERHKIKNIRTPNNVGRIAIDKLNKGLFTEKANLRKFERMLLGEITDPKEAFLGTVADLSRAVATDKYFSKIRQLSDTNTAIGKMFVNPKGDSALKSELRNKGYVELSDSAAKQGEVSSFGSLDGFMVPERIRDDLTRALIGDTNVITSSFRSVYSGFLKAKGYSQYGKTVLSPITQIRNFTTASLFAAAQGNVGRGANVAESFKIAFSDLKDMPAEDAIKSLEKYNKLGLTGTGAEVQEIRKLIEDGYGNGFFGGARESSAEGVNTLGREFGNKITDTTFGNFLGKSAKKFEDAYQASDNTWKIYNFEFEHHKLTNALRGLSKEEKLIYLERTMPEEARFMGEKARAFRQSEGLTVGNLETGASNKYINDLINEEAADIVKNTVPNYNKAPQAIKDLRKLPFGNFTAFPYEILRTGGNTIKRGIDELSFNDPRLSPAANKAIQKIGLRRLTGAATTFGIMPLAVSEFAYQVSGISEEQMEAYQRSFAPPWEKNARLVPIGVDEKGNIQYVNYSYSNPYDLLERMATASINEYQAGNLEGKNIAVNLFNSFSESLGELTAPFSGEAIIFGALRDVANPDSENVFVKIPSSVIGGRGGRTETGSKVYSPQDSFGDKIAKSFNHVIFGAMAPGVSPINVKGGELVAGRFARSIFGGHLGVSEKDRLGRTPKLETELARGLTGITPNTVDYNMVMGYKGFEFGKERTEASNIFNNVAKRANVTRDEVVEAYKNANEARFKVFNKFHRVIEDMKILGLSDTDISKSLKIAGVSDYKRIIMDKYKPLIPSTSVFKKMRLNGTIDRFPKEEINLMIKSQIGRKYTSEIIDEGGQKLVVAKDTSYEAPAQPIVNNRPATVNPYLLKEIDSKPFLLNNNINIDPSLLGSNPIDAAKNAQIAQRNKP